MSTSTAETSATRAPEPRRPQAPAPGPRAAASSSLRRRPSPARASLIVASLDRALPDRLAGLTCRSARTRTASSTRAAS